MSLKPQNKGIVLVALGTALIISCLFREWVTAHLIVTGLFALANPGD